MPSILIVDDVPENLQILQLILRQRDYRVMAATNGNMALKIMDKQLPDLIITDMNMPNMSGIELCQHIKSSSALSHIPIIFISALSETDTIVSAFEVGGVDYITKPFQSSEVLARVATQFKLLDAQAVILKKQMTDLLNEMVIGIAHEINTPLGTSITANSHLESIANDLSEDIDSQTLSLDSLVSKVATFKESSQLCGHNLAKAAEFVEILKSISALQQGGKVEAFILTDMTAALTQFAKEREVTLSIEACEKCQAGFNLDINSLYEIFFRMIDNTNKHVSDGHQKHVNIDLNVINNRLSILFEDCAGGLKGISEKEMLKPFATTKRGNQGHIGLGATLVANIISGPLLGQFQIVPLPSGLKWMIDIPLR